MPSYPTTPAFISYTNGGTESRLREHPVLNFLFHHQESFDHGTMKKEPYTAFHATDFVFTKSDGTVFAPGEASWKGWLDGYAPFAEHLHKARYVNVYEVERDGEGARTWEMMGLANVYGDLHVPGPGEKTKTDLSGRKWDVVVPGALLFKCVEDPEGPKGFKVKSITLFGDGTPVVVEMIKRGMVKPEDLLK